jgi:hypothetical protein
MHDLDRNDLALELDDVEPEYGAPDDDGELPLDDGELMELASDLLAVQDDAELDHFLGGLIGKLRKKVGGIASPLARQVGGLLKGAIKKALPTLATAAGGYLGGPLGASLGGKLAGDASSLLGLELEGLSDEDQEFESAKQLVKLAGSALQNAAGMLGVADPAQAAKSAVMQAAKRYAPGLLVPTTGAGRSGRARGHWYREGNRIVLVGVFQD